MSDDDHNDDVVYTEIVNFNIMDKTPHVDDQYSEGICYPMAVADMVGTCHRMKIERQRHVIVPLTLSPQPLIDVDCKKDAFPILMDTAHGGLQTVEAYPVTRFKSPDGVRYNNDYQRYTIIDGGIFPMHDTRITQQMIAHQFGRNGNHYPMVARIKVGRLNEPGVAEAAFRGPMPYHHPTDRRYLEEVLSQQRPHAVLVVGIDNTSENELEQCCIIKNTRGPVRGDHNGFTKIGFEVIQALHIVHEV